MKTFKLIIFAIVLFCAGTVKAQEVAVNVSIDSPPPWGPVGYTDVRYYYLPDVEAYYDVQSSVFIYNVRSVWVHRTYLPVRYRAYDLYSGYKVVMTDYRGDAPYHSFNVYKTKFPKGFRGEAQKSIGVKSEKGNPKASAISKSPSNKNVSQDKSKKASKSKIKKDSKDKSKKASKGKSKKLSQGKNKIAVDGNKKIKKGSGNGGGKGNKK